MSGSQIDALTLQTTAAFTFYSTIPPSFLCPLLFSLPQQLSAGARDKNKKKPQKPTTQQKIPFFPSPVAVLSLPVLVSQSRARVSSELTLLSA